MTQPIASIIDDSPGPVLTIPAGEWTHTSAIKLGDGSRFKTLKGECYASSILRDTPVNVFGRSNGRLNQDITDGNGPLGGNSGCSVSNLQMIGHGIGGSGDDILIDRVGVWDAPSGVFQIPNQPAVRESTIRDCRFTRCVDPVWLAQPAMKNGDGINNITFRDCVVTYPHSSALHIENTHDDDTIRGVYWHGGLLHSRTRNAAPDDLVYIGGRCNDIAICPDRWIVGTSRVGCRLVEINGRKPSDVTLAGRMVMLKDGRSFSISRPMGVSIDTKNLTRVRINK